MFFKEKKSDQKQVGWNEEFVGSQKSEKLKHFVVPFTDMAFQVIEDPGVEGASALNKNAVHDENKRDKCADEQGNDNDHLQRKQCQLRPKLLYTF